MSAGRRTIRNRARTRRRVLGAGVAGVAAALAVAPLAHASGATPSPTPSSSGNAAKAGTARVDPAGETTTVTPSESTSTVTPNYGYRKIRVGVQEKDGTYPPDQDTSGSEITILETGPDAPDGGFTTTCLTDASTRETGSTATYCVFREIDVRKAPAATRSVADDPDPISDPEDFYQVRPGDSATITQTGLGPNDNKVLMLDDTEKTYGPCTLQDTRLGEDGVCDDPPTVLFNDPGIPPKAVDDSVRTPENTPVTIDVLANDDTVVGAPVTKLMVTSGPSDGAVTPTATAQAVTADAAGPAGPKFVYTPKNGFSGIDHFSYKLTDANGSATAVVTITVPAATTSAAPSSSGLTSTASTPSLSLSATASSSTPPLADTGSPDLSLVELGGLLVAAGGVATVVGRRRRRQGRHAG